MVFGLVVTSKKGLQDELFCVTEERNYFQDKYLEQISELAALREELRKSQNEIRRLRGQVMEQGNNNNSMMSSNNNSNNNLDAASFRTPTKSQRRRRRSSKANNNSSSSNSLSHEEKKVEDAMASSEEEDEAGDAQASHHKDDTASTASTDQEEHFPLEADLDQEEEEEEEEEDEDKEAADIRQSAEKLLQWASYRSSYNTRTTSANVSVNSVSSPTAAAAVSPTSLLGVPQHITEPAAAGMISPSLSQDSGATQPTNNSHNSSHSSSSSSSSSRDLDEEEQVEPAATDTVNTTKEGMTAA